MSEEQTPGDKLIEDTVNELIIREFVKPRKYKKNRDKSDTK